MDPTFVGFGVACDPIHLVPGAECVSPDHSITPEHSIVSMLPVERRLVRISLTAVTFLLCAALPHVDLPAQTTAGMAPFTMDDRRALAASPVVVSFFFEHPAGNDGVFPGRD